MTDEVQTGVAASPVVAPVSPAPNAPVAPAATEPVAPASTTFGADGAPIDQPKPLPVFHPGEHRVPDANDVVVNGVIVGRHSDQSVREEIEAKAKEWFGKIKAIF